ncbi:hypothetical protein [Thermopirellula anaerolimosa]
MNSSADKALNSADSFTPEGASPLKKAHIFLYSLGTLLLVILSISVRAHNLGAFALTQDEPAVGLFVQGKLQDATLRISPLSPFATQIGFTIFGVNEFGARCFSLIAGCISIVLFCIIGFSIARYAGAFIASAIVSLSFYHIYFSQTARYPIFEILFGFALISLIIHELSGHRTARRLWLTVSLFLACAVLGILSHLFFAKLVTAALGGLILLRLNTSRKVVVTVICVVLIVLLTAVCGALAFPDFFARCHFQGGRFLLNVGRVVLWQSPVLWALALLIFVMPNRTGICSWLRGTTLIAIVWMLVFCVVSDYRARYAGWLYPIVATDALVAVAALLESNKRRQSVFIVVVCICASDVLALARYVANNNFRSPMNVAARIIREQSESGDVFLASGINWWSARFYLEDPPIIPIVDAKAFFETRRTPPAAWALWCTLGGRPPERSGYCYRVVENWRSGTPFKSFEYVLLRYERIEETGESPRRLTAPDSDAFNEQSPDQ